MKETRFIKLLESFDKNEIDGFGHFIKCFHPKKERAILLYGHLRRLHPKFPAQKLTLEHLSKTVYKQEINLKNVLNTLSNLYGWARDYLIWQHQANHGLKKELQWLEILNARNMDHEFELKANQIKKKLEQEQPTDNWDYLDRLAFHHKVWTHPMIKRHGTELEVLTKCVDNLEQFYYVSKMNYLAEQLNRDGLYKEGAVSNDLNKRQIHFEKPPAGLLAKVATLQLQLVSGKKKEDYLQLKSLYFSEGQLLSNQSKSILLQHLINYTAGGMRGKNKGYYYPEAFQLYQHALQSGLFLSSGPITSQTFNNIMSTSLWLGEIGWIEQFIDQYAKFIDTPDRKHTEILARALLAFKKGEHDSEYFRELQKMSITDPPSAIRVKTLVMRNLYEANEDKSTLLYFNNAFKKYLSRNKKIKGPVLESCENFAKCFRHLVLNRMSRLEFETEVKNSTPIYFADWLLSKADKFDSEN